MTATLGDGRRAAWQLPERGLSAVEQQEFWKHVDQDSHKPHWLWKGHTNGEKPAHWLHGAYVSAVRIAFGLKYPSRAIPSRIFRRCKMQDCINPACMYAKGFEGTTPDAVGTHEVNPIARGSMLRTVEALGAIQFGLPIKPRTLPDLRGARETLDAIDVEVLDTPEGEVLVEKPEGTSAFVPTEAELLAAPRNLTAEEILAIIFEPDTTVMTFKTGHVWIIKPNGKVDAEDGKSALLGILLRTGKHTVRG